jgi:hypothetical protein
MKERSSSRADDSGTWRTLRSIWGVSNLCVCHAKIISEFTMFGAHSCSDFSALRAMVGSGAGNMLDGSLHLVVSSWELVDVTSPHIHNTMITS